MQETPEFKNGLTAGIVLAVAYMLRYGNTSFTRELINSAGIKPDEDLSFCADYDLQVFREEWPEFAGVYGCDAESIREVKFVVGPALKPYRKQKEWLTLELLHSAPSAYFCLVDGKPGAQLEHPKGGPLGWVQCPIPNVVGVVRDGDKWHWHVLEKPL